MYEVDDDPRVTGKHVRTIASQGGTITLVGVAHDHPASTYRAHTIVDRCDPDVLALELPPLAVPLFRLYATDSRHPPAFGGEMSAAIQAARSDTLVGIDGPSRAFLRELLETLYTERASLGTLRDVTTGLATATKRALLCRTAATVSAATSIRLEVEQPRTYDVDSTTDPADQAADERVHLRRAQAVSGSLVPPADTRIRDAAREAYMAERLATLGISSDVVAIVGRGHLEPVARQLEDR